MSTFVRRDVSALRNGHSDMMIQSDSILEIAPKENVEAYAYLFAIEVGLRELIIERLRVVGGHGWYKTRLPPDVLASYKEGRRKERAAPWTRFVHHDPLYYIDFPSLSKILNTGQNWREAFRDLGSKEVLLGALRSIEEIRNKIAHNRKVTQPDLAILQQVYSQVETLIGRDHFRLLVSRCSSASGALETLRLLRTEAERCNAACSNCVPLPERNVWRIVQSSPWRGMLSVEVSFDDVEAYFDILAEYSSLPASWRGYQIEQWTNERNVTELYRRADAALSQLIDEVNND